MGRSAASSRGRCNDVVSPHPALPGLGRLDVDDEAGGIGELEGPDAGGPGKTGAPAEDRLEIADLLELLEHREVRCQVTAAGIALGATCAMEDDPQTARALQGDLYPTRIFHELGRCLARDRVRRHVSCSSG